MAGSVKRIENAVRPEGLKTLEQEIDVLTREKKNLVSNQDYEKAAAVRDKVRELKSRIDIFNKGWHTTRENKRVLPTNNRFSNILDNTFIYYSTISAWRKCWLWK